MTSVPAPIGRPTSLDRAETDRKSLARNMRRNLNTAMAELGDELPAIVRQAIDMAKDGDKGMIKLLIELPFKAHGLMDDSDESVFSAVRETWTYKRVEHGRDEEVEDSEPAADAEYRAVE